MLSFVLALTAVGHAASADVGGNLTITDDVLAFARAHPSLDAHALARAYASAGTAAGSRVASQSLDHGDDGNADAFGCGANAADAVPPPGPWEAAARKALARVIDFMGAPAAELERPWVLWLCAMNGALHVQQIFMEGSDKRRFPTKKGERKVAAFAEMQLKYAGTFHAVLFAHIASGSTAVLCSALALVLDSTPLAVVASATEAIVHGPTALALSPIVYGDRGVTPFLYVLTSSLLMLSALSALAESTAPGAGERPELRRMACTLSIFLYVRLYPFMRGVGGVLRKQKYTVAVLGAGTTMLPVVWARWMFPCVFWALMLHNRKTVWETYWLIREVGIDAAAAKQAKLA